MTDRPVRVEVGSVVVDRSDLVLVLDPHRALFDGESLLAARRRLRDALGPAGTEPAVLPDCACSLTRCWLDAMASVEARAEVSSQVQCVRRPR